MSRDVKIIFAVIALFFTGAIESYSGDDAGIIRSFRDRDSLCSSGTLVDSRHNIKTSYQITYQDNNPHIIIENIYYSYSTKVNSELNYSSIIHNAANSILNNSDLIVASENSTPEIILYCPDNWSVEQVTPNPYQKNIILNYCQQCTEYTKLKAKKKSDEDGNEIMSVTHQAIIYEINEAQKSALSCTKINAFSAINDKSQNLQPEEPTSNDPFWSLYGNNINSEEQFLGTSPESSSPLIFKTKGVERMRIEANGQIEISDNDPDNPPHAVPQTHTDYLLAVEGKILAQEIVVTPKIDWPDYVFDDGYNLQELSDLEKNIKNDGHLPGMPSDSAINRNGANLIELQAQMLKKIEELTLYIIRLNKDNEALKKRIEILEKPEAVKK